MKKKVFRFASACLLIVVAFVVNATSPAALTKNFTNNYGIEITSEQYDRLINLGFDHNQIYYMPKDIFEENKDLVGTLVAKTQKYYKTVYTSYGNSYTVEVTPEEYYNHPEDPIRGQIITNYKTLLSSISSVGNYYRFNSTLSWNNIPSVHSYDVHAIGYTGLIHINGTMTFYYTYTNSQGVSTTSYSTYSKQYFTNGASATYKLPSSFIGLTSTMYYNVARDNNAGTITSLHMCADYAHATQNVTGNEAASHSVNINGINFAGSVINKFDSMPCADSYLSVNW